MVVSTSSVDALASKFSDNKYFCHYFSSDFLDFKAFCIRSFVELLLSFSLNFNAISMVLFEMLFSCAICNRKAL